MGYQINSPYCDYSFINEIISAIICELKVLFIEQKTIIINVLNLRKFMLIFNKE